jgi:hypothetical protein
MSLELDAAKERAEAVEALERVVASMQALRARLLADEAVGPVLRHWVGLKQGPDMLAVVGALSRCARLEEAAARPVVRRERPSCLAPLLNRWRDGKALAAGGAHD